MSWVTYASIPAPYLIKNFKCTRYVSSAISWIAKDASELQHGSHLMEPSSQRPQETAEAAGVLAARTSIFLNLLSAKLSRTSSQMSVLIKLLYLLINELTFGVQALFALSRKFTSWKVKASGVSEKSVWTPVLLQMRKPKPGGVMRLTWGFAARSGADEAWDRSPGIPLAQEEPKRKRWTWTQRDAT